MASAKNAKKSVSKPAKAVSVESKVDAAEPLKADKAVKARKSNAPKSNAPKAKAPKAEAPAAPIKAAKKAGVPKSITPKTPEAAGEAESRAVKAEIKAESKKARKEKSAPEKAGSEKTARILDSQVAYEGPLFRVQRDHIIEPGGRESHRDVIRHNGSVVILAVDHTKHKKDPWVVIERQYRHAAGQFLWELPAGKLDAGEKPLEGAKRELAEETGYQAKKWSPLVEYFASPGFLGESMRVFLAEDLVAGDAHPEEDEHIDFRLVKLSELLEMVDKGKIIDGKTLTTILLYARQLGIKRKK